MATPRSAAVRKSTVKQAVKTGIKTEGKTITKPVTKPVVKAATKPPVAAQKSAAPATPRAAREKLVRDGFTFPAHEYERIGAMKKRALALGGDAKKSEIVRAALSRLSALADAEFMAALAAVPRIKTGRKKKNQAA